MKVKIFLAAGLVFLLFYVLLLLPAFAASPARVRIEKGVSETVAVQKVTAELQCKWQDEKRILADETHNLELELKLLKARSLKLEGYKNQRSQEILRLEKGLADMAEIGLHLEPYLDELVVKVEDLKNRDLPFAKVERERRLVGLKEALGSYDLSLAEKLRRVMEVLKIETGFGRGFEVSEEVLVIKPGGAETAVRVLRLGRVGLYYLTLDGTRSGWFNRELKTWEELPGASAEALKEALRMALKQRAFDLVKLPVAGGKP